MRVCVFGSSSNRTPEAYLKVSEELGKLIAEKNYLCVNGGGAHGCMGALNRGARAKNGKILGVIHDMFTVETEDGLIQEMLISNGDTLSERKQLLVNNSDCVIVLPGGVGTLDELWESTCNKSLHLGGMEKIPICILNINGYYNGSIEQLKRAGKDNLLYQAVEEYLHVETTPLEALNWCFKQINRLSQSSPTVDQAFSSISNNNRKQNRSFNKNNDSYITSSSLLSSSIINFSSNNISIFSLGVVIGVFFTVISISKK